MNIRAGILFILVALGAVAAATYLPLSTEQERIVAMKDVSESRTLHSGEHIRQLIRPAEGTYSGVFLFSDEKQLGDRRLFVRLSDADGKIIAQSYAVRPSYRSSGDVLQMEVRMPHFTTRANGEYILDISLMRGEGMNLKTVRHEASGEQLMSLSLIKNIPVSFGFRQGVFAGAAFLLAVFCISQIKNESMKMKVAICVLIVAAPLVTLGYWFSAGGLGIADWDYYFTLHDSYRQALLGHHTLPLWNPYICGGTAGLADPEFPMASPTFLLELIFGVPVGVRMAIVLSVAIGAIGMLMLARRLGRSVEAGLVAALAVAFGTVNLLEITEGHVNVLTSMWIPWILWSWHGMVMGNKKPIICGAFLALTFLGGGIYLLMYTALAFMGLLVFVKNRQFAFLCTFQAALWALGFSAFKLIPVLLWLKQFPDDAYATSSYTLPWIGEILFGRHLHGAEIIVNQMSGWHEYGAYIGYIVFGLALIGLAYVKTSRTVRVLALATIVAIGVSTLGPQLRPLFDQLWFFPRSSISRFILFAVIPLALLSSYGLDRFSEYFPLHGKYIRVFLVGLIAMDIFSLTYQLSQQAFVLPHVVAAILPAPDPIAYTPERFDDGGSGSRNTRAYDAYKAGYGTLTYCSVLGPKPAVRTIYDEDSSIVSVFDKSAHVELLSWSYNDVRVRVTSMRDTVIVLNTNYANGWTVNGKKPIIIDNRVAMRVAAGTNEVLFSYRTPGLWFGFITTSIAILFGVRNLFAKHHHNYSSKV